MSFDRGRPRPYTMSPLSQWVDRFFDQAFGPAYMAAGDGGTTGFQSLPVNVWETGDGYHAALLPPAPAGGRRRPGPRGGDLPERAAVGHDAEGRACQAAPDPGAGREHA